MRQGYGRPSQRRVCRVRPSQRAPMRRRPGRRPSWQALQGHQDCPPRMMGCRWRRCAHRQERGHYSGPVPAPMRPATFLCNPAPGVRHPGGMAQRPHQPGQYPGRGLFPVSHTGDRSCWTGPAAVPADLWTRSPKWWNKRENPSGLHRRIFIEAIYFSPNQQRTKAAGRGSDRAHLVAERC